MVVAILGQDFPAFGVRDFNSFPPCFAFAPLVLQETQVFRTYASLRPPWNEQLPKPLFHLRRKLALKFPVALLFMLLWILLNSFNSKPIIQSCLTHTAKDLAWGQTHSKLRIVLTTSCPGLHPKTLLLKKPTSKNSWFARWDSQASATRTSRKMELMLQKGDGHNVEHLLCMIEDEYTEII